MRDRDPALRYDGVLFDVGGTLIGFHDPVPFGNFLREAGLSGTPDRAAHLQQRLHNVIAGRRGSAVGLGADEATLYGWWRSVFAETWPGNPELAGRMHHWLLEGRFDRVHDDVVPALNGLIQFGLRLAIVSNFGAHLDDLLDRLQLRRYFDFAVASAKVGLAKPDPRIFDLAVARAGIARNRLLYVGDHIGDDIEGARAAALDAVLIDRLGRHAESGCSRIGSLEELLRYVRFPDRRARAIILDMDGVVLDSPPAHLQSWQATLAPYGVDLQKLAFHLLEGMPTERTAEVLTEQYLGRACSADQARELAATKRKHFASMFGSALVPGALSLVHNLHGRGFRIGLVTGSARTVVDASLGPTGLAGLFDVLITGDQVTHGKPDPEPYRLALDQFGLEADECLVVENAPLGIRSARAAGIPCVAVQTTLPASHLLEAERVFPDIPALRDWLLGG